MVNKGKKHQLRKKTKSKQQKSGFMDEESLLKNQKKLRH